MMSLESLERRITNLNGRVKGYVKKLEKRCEYLERQCLIYGYCFDGQWHRFYVKDIVQVPEALKIEGYWIILLNGEKKIIKTRNVVVINEEVEKKKRLIAGL